MYLKLNIVPMYFYFIRYFNLLSILSSFLFFLKFPNHSFISPLTIRECHSLKVGEEREMKLGD